MESNANKPWLNLGAGMGMKHWERKGKRYSRYCLLGRSTRLILKTSSWKVGPSAGTAQMTANFANPFVCCLTNYSRRRAASTCCPASCDSRIINVPTVVNDFISLKQRAQRAQLCYTSSYHSLTTLTLITIRTYGSFLRCWLLFHQTVGETVLTPTRKIQPHCNTIITNSHNIWWSCNSGLRDILIFCPTHICKRLKEVHCLAAKSVALRLSTFLLNTFRYMLKRIIDRIVSQRLKKKTKSVGL